MNDHESDVFVVCTSNDVSKLPPEFSRAERFDGIFFIDLPDRNERAAIWRLYQRLYEIPDAAFPMGEAASFSDDNWTGAEIRACCRLTRLLDIPVREAAQNVVPVALTASDKVSALRGWAAGRCLDASRGGVYHPERSEPGRAAPRRNLRGNHRG